MSEIITLDACGLSCPQPALQTDQLLKKLTSGTVQVIVDSGTARDNVARIAQKAGWKVTIETNPGEGFRLVITK